MKLHYALLKQDIKDGYDHMNYHQSIYQGDLSIMVDGRFLCVRFHFERDGYFMNFNIPFDVFVKMSYKELTKTFCEHMYYNFSHCE